VRFFSLVEFSDQNVDESLWTNHDFLYHEISSWLWRDCYISNQKAM